MAYDAIMPYLLSAGCIAAAANAAQSRSALMLCVWIVVGAYLLHEAIVKGAA